ncbi:DUF4267 domain-containing protein [Actinocatenispora rupis]|uniref:Membrane protein n=1 Tax=Actinocatenispora rupis TaxID=519421 RepID=A0A8J3J253_9ACTN|nr:DUF4267 domain-containing protein [Actinocatenispora rupis]GID10156.1 membrane protein [Actinocatenispora rupis]
MLATIATILAVLVGAAVIVMGTVPFWAPRAAAGFGIPDTPVDDRTFRAWLTVKGMRDIGLGVLLLVVLIAGTPHLLGWVLLAAAVIPAGDAVIVLRSNGPRTTAYGVHAATAAVMLAISTLLLIT